MNPLLDAAKVLGDDSPDEDDQNMTASDSPAANENGIGSYERFMSSFGSPTRWAGR